jgi:Tfp pilus assembly protein PilW
MQRGDHGLSVVELAVVMVVGTVLLTAATSFVVGMTRAVRAVNVSTASVSDARRAIEAVSRTLRVGYRPSGATAAVVSATSSSLDFYALLNRTGSASSNQLPPTRVRYSWDGTCLNETQTSAGVATSKCLVRTSVAPAFSYYPSPQLDATALDATPALRNSDLPLVQSVEVTITVKDPTDPKAKSVPEKIRVTLANVVAATGFAS